MSERSASHQPQRKGQEPIQVSLEPIDMKVESNLVDLKQQEREKKV